MNSRGGADYTIIKLNNTNVDDLVALHKIVYGVHPPKDHYRLKYDTAVLGMESIGFICYYKSTMPVAFCGLIPCQMQYQDDIVPAGQSLDAMTHPDHRGKGLYLEINELITSICVERGMKFLFGFPNQNLSPIFIQKLKWQQLGNMQCFEIKTGSLPFHKLSKYLITWALYEKYKAEVLRKHILPRKGGGSSLTKEGFAGIYRDKKYLEYKTHTGCLIMDTGNGSQAWIRVNNSLYIGDIIADERGVHHTIVFLKKLTRLLGIRKIFFQSSPGTSLEAEFLKEYIPFDTFPIMVKDLGWGVPMEKIKFTFGDIDVF